MKQTQLRTIYSVLVASFALILFLLTFALPRIAHYFSSTNAELNYLVVPYLIAFASGLGCAIVAVSMLWLGVTLIRDALASDILLNRISNMVTVFLTLTTGIASMVFIHMVFVVESGGPAMLFSAILAALLTVGIVLTRKTLSRALANLNRDLHSIEDHTSGTLSARLSQHA